MSMTIMHPGNWSSPQSQFLYAESQFELRLVLLYTAQALTVTFFLPGPLTLLEEPGTFAMGYFYTFNC